MNEKKHYFAAVSAFAVWGFFAIPLRALKDYGSGEILYFRILISASILIFITILFRKNEVKNDLNSFQLLSKKNRLKTILLTISGGILLSVNWLTFIYIVNNINIKTASFSYLICPVITAILGFILLNEKLTKIQWISVALCSLSCILIGISSIIELSLSFLTAFTYALYLISQRKNQGFDRLNILGIQVIVSLLLLTLFSNFLISQIPISPFFYLIIIVIAVVFTVVPLFLNLFALNKINSATIGILMYINPLINFSVAFLFFKEKISDVQFIGYIIITFALVLFNTAQIKKIKLKTLERRAL